VVGDVSAAERDFVRGQLDKPVDVRGLAGAVPQGLEAQVYMMSVLGIDLDSKAEAQYLPWWSSPDGKARPTSTKNTT